MRHDSDSDLSPPRKTSPDTMCSGLRAGSVRGGNVKEEAKAAKRPKAHKNERVRHYSDSDLSPPRKTSPDKMCSGLRAGSVRGCNVKEEGKRASGSEKARHDSDSDLSPPRKTSPEKMSSGLRAGLVRGSDLKEEAKKVRQERREAVLAAPDEETGRNAQTVYRNRSGAKIGREEWVADQQKKKRKKLSEYPEQELEWGGGVKQRCNEDEEKRELERIAAQPFARYQPDEKYMEELKERQDWNDPMRKFQDEYDKAEAKDARVSAQSLVKSDVPKKKPRCPHAPWPNRFSILPGYRWDGKVRGIDFEKRWLETKNHRDGEQARRWQWEMEEM